MVPVLLHPPAATAPGIAPGSSQVFAKIRAAVAGEIR
jgi:hypothetical protein